MFSRINIWYEQRAKGRNVRPPRDNNDYSEEV